MLSFIDFPAVHREEKIAKQKKPSTKTGRRDADDSAVQQPSDNPGDAFHYKPGQSIGYLLRLSYRSFAKALEVHINQYGVGIGQWFFLRELWEEDGLTQGELASRVGIAAPTTAVAIRGMVKDGLIRQETDSSDRRKKRIVLTGKSRALRTVLLSHAREVNINAIKGFSEKEIRQLRNYLNRMRKNLDNDC